MRILLLELKRVVKSRTTWILLLVAVAFAVAVSLLVVSYATYTYLDQSGQEVKITGIEAIQARQEQMQPYEGPITEDKLQKALTVEQDLYQQYGEEFPIEVYHKELSPIDGFLGMIYSVYPQSGGYYEAISKVDVNGITDFYQQRKAALKENLEAQYPGNDAVLQEALQLNDKVKTPFVFKSGYSSDASDNLAVLIFLIVLISAVIVSPVFSAEYQSGADDILRCAKNGRTKLAVIKIVSALIITCVLFAVCMLIFVLVVNTAYGWNSLQTSVQAVLSVFSFVPFTMGQEQLITILAGFLTLLAVICFTLFLSTKCRNSTTSLIFALAFCLLPAILFSVGKGNAVNLLTSLFPSGGVGMTNSFYYQLNQTTFVSLGSLAIWTPYLMMGAAIIEIPLFFLLSVRSYNKHQSL